MPSGERDWKQYALNAGCTRDGSKKFLVGVDARATARERNRLGLRPLQHLCDRLPNIFHVDWLQSHLAGAEHWIDREPVEELEDSGQKCIIRPKHDRRADENGIGKGVPNRLVHVSGIGADPRSQSLYIRKRGEGELGAGLPRHRFGFKCTQPYRLTARTPLARHGFEHSVAARTAPGATAV